MSEVYIQYKDEDGVIDQIKYNANDREEAIEMFKWGHSGCEVLSVEVWGRKTN